VTGGAVTSGSSALGAVVGSGVFATTGAARRQDSAAGTIAATSSTAAPAPSATVHRIRRRRAAMPATMRSRVPSAPGMRASNRVNALLSSCSVMIAPAGHRGGIHGLAQRLQSP
jgi:hypothetical protein